MKPQQLGRYLLLDKIAAGGMAEIYRAWNIGEDGGRRLVAVKKILPRLVRDKELLEMLVQEARIAAKIDHENVAGVTGFGRSGDQYFIVMDYVDGRDLRSILDRCRKRRVRLDPEDCAYVMMKALRGLHAAHCMRDAKGRTLGIIHRDVSPSNVIISHDGTVKLIDFGIAKVNQSSVQTKTGVIKGKAKYMSPEQALGRPLDARSDQFSAASVLYELLTLRPPFVGANELQVLITVRDAQYKAIEDLRPQVPLGLRRIADRALSKPRSARFPSAAAMAEALARFMRGYSPKYHPMRLQRLLRKLFAEEIERDLRLLEEYALVDLDPLEFGEKLLLDETNPKAAPTWVSGALENLDKTKADRKPPGPPPPPPEATRVPPPRRKRRADQKTEVMNPGKARVKK